MSETGKILTANLLLTGDVVFYAADGSWVIRPDEALFATTDDEVATLAAAEKKQVSENVVVSTEIIPAARTQNGVWPTRNREQIRAKGPTVATDLGYQARFDLSGFQGA